MKNAKNIRTIIACATLAVVPAICLNVTPIDYRAATPAVNTDTPASLADIGKANI